jgi:hypothetical protein
VDVEELGRYSVGWAKGLDAETASSMSELVAGRLSSMWSIKS